MVAYGNSGQVKSAISTSRDWICVRVSSAGAAEDRAAGCVDHLCTIPHSVALRAERQAPLGACLQLASFIELTKLSSRSSNPPAWRQAASLEGDIVRTPILSKISVRVPW